MTVLYPTGIIALAGVIPGMRAISSVNLLQNNIDIDQAGALVSMLKNHPTLKSLCGNEGDETELDMSSKMSGAGDAIILVAEIVDNRALTVLSLQKNNLHAAGGKALAAGLKGNRVITELNISSNRLGYNTPINSGAGTDMSGVIALADVIPDMRALAKFDISNNNLNAGGCKAIVGALKGNSTLTELNVAKNDMTYGEGWGDMSAVIALANAIPDMRALAKLDMSSNNIGAEQEEDLQRICMAGGIELTQ
jgi:hypothetical protein